MPDFDCEDLEDLRVGLNCQLENPFTNRRRVGALKRRVISQARRQGCTVMPAGELFLGEFHILAVE